MSLEIVPDRSVVRESCCKLNYIAAGVAAGLLCSSLVAGAFFVGRQTAQTTTIPGLGNVPTNRIPAELLNATATHGGTNMAVCTAPVDENAEGFFVLDYLTGDLKGWVYYPRMGAFGGQFMTNVQGFLGSNKNPEYLLVSGGAASVSTGGNVKPAASLIYVVDVKTGAFVAYTIPWSRSTELSGAAQGGTFVPVGGDQIRAPMAGGKKAPAPPANGNANGKANPQGANGTDPDDPNNPQLNNPGAKPNVQPNANKPKNPR